MSESGGGMFSGTRDKSHTHPIAVIVTLCIVLLASVAQAMVYMWRDSTGTAYYTNKEYDIPTRYKAKVKVLYPDSPDSGQSQAKNATVQTTPAVPVAPVVTPQATQVVQQNVNMERPGAQTHKSSSRTSEIKPRGNRVRRVEEEE
jgi:hypothetical protein